MIEAIIFGFFAYFGTEMAEYAHEKYDQIKQCVETQCNNENNVSPEGEIQILDEDEKELSTTELGDNNG